MAAARTRVGASLVVLAILLFRVVKLRCASLLVTDQSSFHISHAHKMSALTKPNAPTAHALGSVQVREDPAMGKLLLIYIARRRFMSLGTVVGGMSVPKLLI